MCITYVCVSHSILLLILCSQCLNQLILIYQHVEGMITNGNTQYCLTNRTCIMLVECLNSSVVDSDHCIALHVCVVLLCVCIVLSTHVYVKPNRMR